MHEFAMSAWAKTLLRRRLGGPFWVLRCAARLPGVGSMSTLTAPAKEQRWSTCRPCSVRRHAPASTAAGPCYNIIHEPTGLLNDTEDLPTDVANVLHRPETADNANPLLFLSLLQHRRDQCRRAEALRDRRDRCFRGKAHGLAARMHSMDVRHRARACGSVGELPERGCMCHRVWLCVVRHAAVAQLCSAAHRTKARGGVPAVRVGGADTRDTLAGRHGVAHVAVQQCLPGRRRRRNV